MTRDLRPYDDYPFVVCKNCLEAFDFEDVLEPGLWDKERRVQLYSYYKDKLSPDNYGDWAELKCVCPHCYHEDTYTKGEWHFVDGDKKVLAATEADN